MCSFEADFGWTPRSSLDWISRNPVDTVQRLSEFRATMDESFKITIFSHRLAQARQSTYNAKKYRPPCCKVGDEVYLSKKLFTDSASLARPSQKLSVHSFGPFPAVEIINRNVIGVQLPEDIKTHPIIHLKHSTRARHQNTENTIHSGTPVEPYIDDRGDSVIKVAEILAHCKRGHGWQFITLYAGMPHHDAEWKPLRDIVDDDGTITEALHVYIMKHDIYYLH